jgi:hypothetical protein
MLKKLFLPCILILAGLSSCKDSGVTLPSVTGTRYEILVVMDDSLWKAPSGRALVGLLDQDMPSLPQSEPIMSISHCTRREFSDILKPARNILLTEVAPRYEIAKVTLSKNRWAQPQSVVKIVAKSDSLLADLIKREGDNILEFFLSTERNRYIAFSKEYINQTAKKEIEEKFGVSIDIPEELKKSQKGKDFYWITNNSGTIRKDMVIYSIPYTSTKLLTKQKLIAIRDSVMKVNIPGEFEGSYMGTELKYCDPLFREINVNKNYCAELSGLWKMYNGGSMGGPFYSHSRIDEVNQRIITVEGFVFAPGTKKRNHIRQLEAAIYTMKLPQERNAIKEVSVVAEKKTNKK